MLNIIREQQNSLRYQGYHPQHGLFSFSHPRIVII
jgi:hypothetical protein